MADTPEEAIEENVLQGLKRVSVQGHEVEVHSLPDQIQAAQYLAAQSAKSQPHRGLRFTKIVPPGAG